MDLKGTSKQLICRDKGWMTNDRQKELLARKDTLQICKKVLNRELPALH